MAKPEGKDISNVRFGRAVSHARKKAGLTQLALSNRIGCSKSHISNIECGDRKLAAADVAKADGAVHAEGRLIRLYQELYEPEHLDWVGRLHQLQADAEVVREFHNSLVPGALQVPEYTLALVKGGAPWLSDEEASDFITTRQARAERVLRDRTPHYHVVLDDVVLRRPLGPPDVMRKQIERLASLISSGRLLLQLYPWGLCPHPGVDGPFMMISSVAAPDVIHIESPLHGHTSDDPATVRRYGMLFSKLQAMARAPAETEVLLQEMIEEYSHVDRRPALAQVELQRRDTELR